MLLVGWGDPARMAGTGQKFSTSASGAVGRQNALLLLEQLDLRIAALGKGCVLPDDDTSVGNGDAARKKSATYPVEA